MTLLSCTSVEAGEQWTSYDRTTFLQVGLGFRASKTLLSAAEMEVFTELAKHRRISNIADRIVGVVRHEGILLVNRPRTRCALDHPAECLNSVWRVRLKNFYVQYFDGVAGPRYENPSKDFAFYFITLAGGSRLEISQTPSIPRSLDDIHRQFTGFIHVAFAPDSAKEIDRLTAVLRTAEWCVVLEPPHMTGDGYYESVILDPDGNRVELSCPAMAYVGLIPCEDSTVLAPG